MHSNTKQQLLNVNKLRHRRRRWRSEKQHYNPYLDTNYLYRPHILCSTREFCTSAAKAEQNSNANKKQQHLAITKTTETTKQQQQQCMLYAMIVVAVVIVVDFCDVVAASCESPKQLRGVFTLPSRAPTSFVRFATSLAMHCGCHFFIASYTATTFSLQQLLLNNISFVSKWLLCMRIGGEACRGAV